MGKRIKWFTEAETDLTRMGTLDYEDYFSVEHL
jgi:hypothetical protein